MLGRRAPQRSLWDVPGGGDGHSRRRAPGRRPGWANASARTKPHPQDASRHPCNGCSCQSATPTESMMNTTIAAMNTGSNHAYCAGKNIARLQNVRKPADGTTTGHPARGRSEVELYRRMFNSAAMARKLIFPAACCSRMTEPREGAPAPWRLRSLSGRAGLGDDGRSGLEPQLKSPAEQAGAF
jgi:hypothetical protein